MKSPEFVLWCVDAQKDFMLPGGKLYVPGAEKLLPNINRLVDAARKGHIFLISHGCFHTPDDPEFQTFPPHCVKGTDGAEFVKEALTGKHVRVTNEPGSSVPADARDHCQIILEKETLDIFEGRHAHGLLDYFDRGTVFVVFGVVTEYCVRLAAKGLLDRGRKVWIVRDAIETLDSDAGEKTLGELTKRGAKLVTTDEVLAEIHADEKRSRLPVDKR